MASGPTACNSFAISCSFFVIPISGLAVAFRRCTSNSGFAPNAFARRKKITTKQVMPNLALTVLNSELQSKPQPLVRDPTEHEKDTADAAENQADEPVALPPGQGGDGGDGDRDLEKGDAVRKNF